MMGEFPEFLIKNFSDACEKLEENRIQAITFVREFHLLENQILGGGRSEATEFRLIWLPQNLIQMESAPV